VTIIKILFAILSTFVSWIFLLYGVFTVHWTMFIPFVGMSYLILKIFQALKFFFSNGNLWDNLALVTEDYGWARFFSRFDIKITEDQARDVAKHLRLDSKMFTSWLHSP